MWAATACRRPVSSATLVEALTVRRYKSGSRFHIPTNPAMPRPPRAVRGKRATEQQEDPRWTVVGDGAPRARPGSAGPPRGSKTDTGRGGGGGGGWQPRSVYARVVRDDPADVGGPGESAQGRRLQAPSPQDAFEQATSSRGRGGYVDSRNVDAAAAAFAANTLSGETYRERQAAAARGEGAASSYRFVRPEYPGGKPPGSSPPRHIDPDATVDNYIPVAQTAPVDGIYADAPQKRVPRASGDGGDASAAGTLRVEMEGESAIDPRGDDIGDGTVSVSGRSALFRSAIAPLPLSSRKGKSTWSTVKKASTVVEAELERRSTPDELRRSEGHTLDRFEDTSLEHMKEAVQYSTSVYTKKALVIDGVSGYHDFLTRREEEDMMRELTPLMTDASLSHFEAEEGRYVLNLFEKDLGVATEAPMALAFSRSAPTLHRVLQRAFDVGLIPAMPNTVQISEYVTPYGGYKPHVKHSSLGQYLGLLSLVSDSLMVMRHVDQPWWPQVDVVRRSMYVISTPALYEYAIGYPDLDRTVRAHQFKSRMTKDYRFEILFATVDAPRVPALGNVLKLTEASERHGLAEIAERAGDAGVRRFTKGGPSGEGPLTV